MAVCLICLRPLALMLESSDRGQLISCFEMFFSYWQVVFDAVADVITQSNMKEIGLI